MLRFIFKKFILLIFYAIYKLFRLGAFDGVFRALALSTQKLDDIFTLKLKKRIKDTTADDTDYLLYGFMLHSNKAKKVLKLDHLSSDELHKLYKQSIKKSMDLGSFDSKIKFTQILYQEAIDYRNTTVNREKLQQALIIFEEILKTQCTCGDLWVISPDFHAYEKRKNVKDLITNKVYWVKNIFDSDNKHFKALPDIIQQAQLLMLLDMVKCHPTSIGLTASNRSCDDAITFYYTAEKLLQHPSISYYPPRNIEKDREIRLREKAEILYSAFLEKYPMIATKCP